MATMTRSKPAKGKTSARSGKAAGKAAPGRNGYVGLELSWAGGR